MSTTAVEKFLTKVSEDTALQSQLQEALSVDNDREAVTQLANQKGYEFSSEELWVEIQKRQAEFEQKKQAGELSDEELEAVAGGATPAVSVLATVALKVATVTAVGSAVGGSAAYGISKAKW